MITFIIPFVSKAVSKNWDHSCECLSNTIDSVWQLPGKEVSILVVGHERPPINQFGSRCGWLPVSFSAPNPSVVAEKLQDKGLKLQEGVRYIFRNQSADWVMFMDADDFVSKSLLEYCDLDNHEAICLRQGYSWKLGAPKLEKLQRFDQICGSSWLMRCTPKLFPVWLGDGGGRLCDQAHNQRAKALRAAGIVVQEVDNPSIIYAIGHVGNTYHGSGVRVANVGLRQIAKYLRSRFQTRRVTPEIEDEFGIPKV